MKAIQDDDFTPDSISEGHEDLDGITKKSEGVWIYYDRKDGDYELYADKPSFDRLSWSEHVEFIEFGKSISY